MENYTPVTPVFSDTISITGYGDPVHPDYVNPAPRQLLQNDLVLQTGLGGKADDLVFDEENSKLKLMAGEQLLAEVSVSGATADVSEAVKNLSSDLSNIAFQLALQNLIDTGDLVTVHVYEIDSASSITIISGQYANKKVYI